MPAYFAGLLLRQRFLDDAPLLCSTVVTVRLGCRAPRASPGAYNYDGNGNPTTYTSPSNPVSGVANTNTFDPENRMTAYGVSVSSALLSATYDSDGLRTKKVANGVTTSYVYDEQDRPVAELNSGGAIVFVNTFGDNGLLSRRDVAGGVTTYYAFDPQGSAVDVMQGGNGLPAAYSAFGIPASGGASSSPFGFGAQWGYYTDAETGLILCTHRYYDPYTGRFLNRDPFSYFGGVNLYNHVTNNPINNVDPDGTLAPNAPATTAGAEEVVEELAGNTAGKAVLGTILGTFGLGLGLFLGNQGGLADDTLGYQNARPSKTSGKDRASNVPSWTLYYPRYYGESCEQFANRILNDKYGVGNWHKGAKTEYNQIMKGCTRGNKYPPSAHRPAPSCTT